MLLSIIEDKGSESETEDAPDVDEHDFFDDIKMNEEDARALEMFQNKYGFLSTISHIIFM